MADDVTVRVHGLRELSRGLRQVNLGSALQKANKKAAEVVVEPSRQAAAAAGGVARREVPTIRALATQTRAQIAFGGNPWSMGAAFGSIRYRQFRPWRGSGGDAGYYVFPQIRSMRDQILDVHGDAVMDELTRSAFPD